MKTDTTQKRLKLVNIHRLLQMQKDIIEIDKNIKFELNYLNNTYTNGK